MDSKIYETRHVFMTIGICIALFVPWVLFFVPQTIANMAHHTNNTWYVFTPDENFYAYGVGFLFFILACAVLFLMDVRKKSIILSIFLVFAGILTFIAASQSYISLSEDSVSYSSLFSMDKYTYAWSEVEAIILDDNEDGYLEYEFRFIDGNSMKLENNDYLREIQHRFDRKLQEMNIKLVYANFD